MARDHKQALAKRRVDPSLWGSLSGANVCELMREHPEFGLRPIGLLDGGPRRRNLSVQSLGSSADLVKVRL